MAKRSQPARNSNPRDPALFELQRQMLTQAETAASLLEQTVGASVQSERLLNEIRDILSSMASGTAATGPAGGGAPFFPGAGPSNYGFGPNGGRPIMPPNQTQRPGLGGIPYGPGGAPGYGGPGYGGPGSPFPHGGYGGGYARGGMGGMLGYAQTGAARVVHGVMGAGRGGAVSYRQNSDGTYNSYDHQGNVVEENIDQQTAQKRASVSSSAGRMASSGSLIGAIQSIPVVGKIAGAVMLPLEAAQKLGNFVGDQRAANAQYEQVYGPGTSGWDQRMHDFGGRFRNTLGNIGSIFGGAGGLSDSDYDQAFKSISAMGFQGGARNNMIGFATRNFNDLGMSVGDSLQLISVNAKEASTSFSTLSDQLKAVSEMAQQTGQSAEVMRQSFTRSYSNAVNAGFGQGSGAIAQAQVAATAGQGRAFTGLDTSAMYSSLGGQQVLASRMGYSSVLDFGLAASQNPQVLATAQDKQLDMLMQSVVSPDVRNLVEQSIKRHGGPQVVANNLTSARDVVADVERQRPNALNIYAIQGAMRAAGIAGAENLTNPQDIAAYYVQWVAKQGRTFGAPTAAAMAQNDQQLVGSVPSAEGTLSNRRLAQMFQQAGGPNHNVGGQNSFAKEAGLEYGGDAYHVNKRGQLDVDPVIGKLERDHVSYVRVQTAKGPEVVSVPDASRHYRDQLVNGTAIIMSGPNTGDPIKQHYGAERNAHYGTSTDHKPTDYEIHHPVVSTRAWKAIGGMGLSNTQMDKLVSDAKGKNSDQVIAEAHKLATQQAATSKVTGAITVGLKPEVARYLEITTSGDNLVNTAAAAGGPPAINGSGSSTGR